jgi:toxin CcdB
MAKYDLYSGIGDADFVLDVQSDLLNALNTRIVIPLFLNEKAPKPADRLNPIFEIDGKSYVMTTQFLASVSRSELTTPMGNLSPRSDEITNAIDMVFQGF